MESSPASIFHDSAENDLADINTSAGADIAVGKVVLCTISNGRPTLQYVESLINFREHDRVNGCRMTNIILEPSSALTHISRNKVCENVHLNYKEEWMLWIDDDIQFDVHLVDQLLEYADPVLRPVITASYKHPLPTGLVPSAFKYDWAPEPHPLHKDKYKTFLPIGQEEFDKRAKIAWQHLIRIDGAGTGCMLIHRSVLKTFLDNHFYPIAWFHTDISEYDVVLGEDLTFCYRLMKLGIPLYCRTDIQLRHIKTVAYE